MPGTTLQVINPGVYNFLELPPPWGVEKIGHQKVTFSKKLDTFLPNFIDFSL